MSNVNETLKERGSRYGNFLYHADITQDLKILLRNHIRQHNPNTLLDADQWEAIDMICHKLGRIVNGDPHYSDSWIDIAGYATLVANRLEGKTDSGETK